MSSAPPVSGPGLADLRAALWSLRVHAGLRRRLARLGVEATVPAPPPLPSAAVRGVRFALRRRNASCLESAVMLQRWHAVHGRPLDLVIGVTAPEHGFRAHAWLEGEDPAPDGTFTEILRRPVAEAGPPDR